MIQKEADEEVEEKLRTQKEKLQPKPSGTGDSGLNKGNHANVTYLVHQINFIQNVSLHYKELFIFS